MGSETAVIFGHEFVDLLVNNASAAKFNRGSKSFCGISKWLSMQVVSTWFQEEGSVGKCQV